MKRSSVQILTALMVIMILGAVWLLLPSRPEPATPAETENQTDTPPSSTITPMIRPGRPPSTEAAFPFPAGGPGPAQPILTRLLSVDAENPLRPEEARDLVEQLKQLGQAALPDIHTLLTNNGVHERVLGLHLMLEVGGVSDQVLQWAAADSSPHVPAQAAAWLYENGQFKEWENFVAQSATHLDMTKLEPLWKALETKPPGLTSNPAIANLSLGQSLPDYAQELFRRNTDALQVVQKTMADPATSPVLKDNLFDLLQNANPPGYADILKEYLSRNSGASPLREKILWHLQNESSDAQIAGFLRQLPGVDAAETERLTAAAHTIEQRANAQFSMVRNLQDAVSDLVQQQNPQQAQATPVLLDKFVSLAKREPNFMPKLEILLAAKDLYAGPPTLPSVSESAWRQKQADVEYLLWRVKQGQP